MKLKEQEKAAKSIAEEQMSRGMLIDVNDKNVKALKDKNSKLKKLNCDLIDNLRKSICDHQKLVVDFVFETMVLVDEILKIRSDNRKLALQIKNLFYNHFYNKRIEVCELSKNYLITYFKMNRGHVPRITVKGLRKSDNHIIDYYRSSGQPFPADSYSFFFEENTAFKHVTDNKGPYCCNDIPSHAKIGAYLNNRLMLDKVKEYSPIKLKLNGRSINQNGLITKLDPEWQKCWKGYQPNAIINPLSCYKSTLVIPIALSHLNSPSKKRLRISADYHSTIFGYLCFDDVCINYFIEKQDINIGYIFADLLSYYLVFINYIEHNLLCERITSLDKDLPEWKYSDLST